MKYSRPVIAGLILTAVAVVFVVLGIGKPGRHAARDAAADAAASATARPAGSPPSGRDAKYPGRERTMVPTESPDAKELKLLWARGRAQELLAALDRLSEAADPDDWRQVAAVLEEQAAKDGRHEVAAYLLATGHGAPAAIRLAIYAAALRNPDEGVRESAKLELLNLTGQEFSSPEDAAAWIASHPEVSREDPAASDPTDE